ncbi:MAG: hypothetical protein KatS3mg005_1790 [Bryobacteraceae bacterium]|nr:MAG: hypothetical protein KatS3mg005_1790 [Bryobacteraceae bacterium]
MGCSPRASARGNPGGRVAARSRAARAMGRCRRLGTVVFEPLGRSPSGCSRAALFGRGGFRFASQNCVFGFWRVLRGEWSPGAGTVGMQPSREREGKPEGNAEGKSAGVGGGLVAPAARCEGSMGWGVGVSNRLVAALRAAPARLCLGFAKLRFWVLEGVVGEWLPGRMQPSRKREGKPEGLAADWPRRHTGASDKVVAARRDNVVRSSRGGKPGPCWEVDAAQKPVSGSV